MSYFLPFQLIFSTVFILVIGVFIFTFVSIFKQWNKNNHSPRLSVEATVISRRTNVSHNHNNINDNFNSYSTTTYYVTFQVESGDRLEFMVNGTEYGMLLEGDRGKLSFQGTRYLGFTRY